MNVRKSIYIYFVQFLELPFGINKASLFMSVFVPLIFKLG